ncbi:MAG: DUF3786 domain-containing protein [Thermoanaerobacteraceae bacterium]|nr:DUF3786 domain-containing protein [Thermoanaerobacteraceae bacterium]
MAEFNLDITWKKAVKDFASEEPQEMAVRVDADYDESNGVVTVRYFGKDIRITYPQAEFDTEELSLVEKILVLHYLTGSLGHPLAGEFISFKELPGGEIYNTPFYNRAVRPFLAAFGVRPKLFALAARQLGGKEQTLGDVSYTFFAFPKVPVTIVMWEGDDEFPPSANILFDKSASDYLPTEDYAILASLTVAKLKTAAAG